MSGVRSPFDGILRLRPGIGLDRLRSAAAGAMADLAHELPSDVLGGRQFVLQPLLASIVGNLRSTLLIVLAATALLLLLACVNVTNLLLARGTGRTRELAVRVALGATRGRLVRQLLTEALVMAGIGAVLGVALAYAAVRLLLTLGASRLPRLATVSFDAHVLLFALGGLGFSAFTVGLTPAWRLTRANRRALPKEGGHSATPSRGTLRSMSTLIVGEVALALMLAAGAGWLVQSFAKLEAIHPWCAAGRRNPYPSLPRES